MAIEIRVPAVGESISEGTLSQWYKKDGDAVRVDEPLYELETDKATQPIVAPAAGTLRILAKVGETVAVGAVVGRLDEAANAKAHAPPTAAAPAGKQESLAPAAPRSTPKTDVAASPAARRLAAEEKVDLAKVAPDGPRGTITKEIVQNELDKKKPAVEQPPASPPPAEKPRAAPAPAPAPAGSGETRERMSGIRQRIAQRLVEAQSNAAILSTFNEVDMTAVLAIRARYKESFEKRHGVSLGFMPFFVKACVEALRAFPIVNARIDGSDIVYSHEQHIGVAVSTEKGLMVPVVRDAGRLGFAEIEKSIAGLAQKARDGKITVPDLQGGTFTITNGGVFGSLLSTPILNPPQSGILGMHTIQKRPVAVDDQVVIRPMMYLALSYDHRLIDGREAVQFLVRVKECVENPERLLLEV